MQNIISKLLVSFALLFSLTKPLYAETVLYGDIKTYKTGLNTYHQPPMLADLCPGFFPLKHYDFSPVRMFNFRYNDKQKITYKIKNISDYMVNLKASLNLIEYNDQSGLVKFELLLEGGKYLTSYEKPPEYYADVILGRKGTPLTDKNVSAKMYDGSPLKFIIEGEMKTIDGKYIWVSHNKNKYFDIYVETPDEINKKNLKCQFSVTLYRLQDIPVIVSTD